MQKSQEDLKQHLDQSQDELKQEFKYEKLLQDMGVLATKFDEVDQYHRPVEQDVIDVNTEMGDNVETGKAKNLNIEVERMKRDIREIRGRT